MAETDTYYISIGNSDDKLTQARWAQFIYEINEEVSNVPGVRLHGEWHSLPLAPWQNACWCIEVNQERHPGTIDHLKEHMARIARYYGQTSIAWAKAEMEFIGGVPA
jgi:hypothetical protein